MAKSSAASSSWGAPGGSIVGLPASYSRADERITVHSGTHTNLVVSPVQSYRIFHATYNSPCLLCDSPFALDSVVVETVGEGSFGKLRRVKLGMHEDTGVRYAVKVMAKSRISTPSLTMQVRREVAVMKAAPHSR